MSQASASPSGPGDVSGTDTGINKSCGDGESISGQPEDHSTPTQLVGTSIQLQDGVDRVLLPKSWLPSWLSQGVEAFSMQGVLALQRRARLQAHQK
eukprot:2394626-Rhodomonas_salina.1